MPDVRDALHAARLYLVCGEQTDAVLEQALRGGVDIVQLRLKDASDEAIVATARRYAAVCHA
ncbi:MAG TPA: thiamine phosphate synthase, partial [Solirubrobacteraceae bacterium]